MCVSLPTDVGLEALKINSSNIIVFKISQFIPFCLTTFREFFCFFFLAFFLVIFLSFFNQDCANEAVLFFQSCSQVSEVDAKYSQKIKDLMVDNSKIR